MLLLCHIMKCCCSILPIKKQTHAFPAIYQTQSSRDCRRMINVTWDDLAHCFPIFSVLVHSLFLTLPHTLSLTLTATPTPHSRLLPSRSAGAQSLTRVRYSACQLCSSSAHAFAFIDSVCSLVCTLLLCLRCCVPSKWIAAAPRRAHGTIAAAAAATGG